MQSNGGVAPIEDTSRTWRCRAILSGPAGGVSAAAYIGQLLGERQAGGSARGLNKVIAFDMGGTSTDISLIENGVPHIANEKFEAGLEDRRPDDRHPHPWSWRGQHRPGGRGWDPPRWPGQRGSGSRPGLLRQGRGRAAHRHRRQPRVLGYLDPANFLGGRASLDPQAAAARSLAGHVGTGRWVFPDVESAFGVYKVVCTTIAEGIRLMSVSTRESTHASSP